MVSVAKDFINLILNIADFVYFRHMYKTLLVGLMTLLFLKGYAQKATHVPRKIRGVYEGKQAAYYITQHNQNIEVAAADMTITLNANGVSVCYQSPLYCPVNNGHINEVKKKGKGKNKSWQLVVSYPNSVLPESIEVFASNKQLIRKGVFPQPNTTLKRLRKK